MWDSEISFGLIYGMESLLGFVGDGYSFVEQTANRYCVLTFSGEDVFLVWGWGVGRVELCEY